MRVDPLSKYSTSVKVLGVKVLSFRTTEKISRLKICINWDSLKYFWEMFSCSKVLHHPLVTSE